MSPLSKRRHVGALQHSVDRPLPLARRITRAVCKDALDFRNNCKCDFFRGLHAEIEAGWREEARIDRYAKIENIVQQFRTFQAHQCREREVRAELAIRVELGSSPLP